VVSAHGGEKKTVQKNHQEIVKALGLYDDQATQEYVQIVGSASRSRATCPTKNSSSSSSTTKPSTRSPPAAATST
jgi:hypothetical protein